MSDGDSICYVKPSPALAGTTTARETVRDRQTGRASCACGDPSACKERRMTNGTPADPSLFRDLGDGLVLRRATFDDRERVAELHANILLGPEETAPANRLYFWVLDLMSG